MRGFCLVSIIALTFGSLPAKAEDATLTFTITNRSGKDITALALTPMGSTEPTSTNVLTASIANGQPGDITVTSIGGACVFELTFTFADQSTVNRPDSDLCQTDGIIVE
jgi:hypothetical protein